MAVARNACAALVALVFFTGLASPAVGVREGFDWHAAVASYNALDRVTVDVEDLAFVEVPLREDGALALHVDWGTGSVHAANDAVAPPLAGCVTALAPGVLPWAVSGTQVGPCDHPGKRHPFALHETVMVCLHVGSYCVTDGFQGLPSNVFGAFLIVCPTPQVATVTWPLGAPWSVPTTQCGLFAAGASPVLWDSWDSVCGFTPGTGVAACSHHGV
jgi:hypothetical protein